MSVFGSTTSTVFGGGGAAASPGRTNSLAANDCPVPQAGNDGVSSLIWSPVANILVSSNWDGGIRCWEIQEQGGQIRATPRAQANHEKQAPVLDSCFSNDGSTVYSAGCDFAVRQWHLGQTPPNNVAIQIGAHDQPVRSVTLLPTTNLVVSGGWDNKLKFWDTRTPSPVMVMDLPDRVYGMDCRGSLLVVATAGRHILCYDCTGQPRLHQQKESPLKFQSRCVSCFPDGTGYAVGSIEGRVGIQYVQRVPGKESFAFKCHRQDAAVFAVNDICFHNVFGTFATVGSDCVVNFWDKDNKQRLKGFNPVQRTIPTASFNTQGSLFAYASSYDWSKGSMHVQPGNEIYIHYVLEDEIKPKSKKSTAYKR